MDPATEAFTNGTSSAHDVLAENVKFPDEEQHDPFYDAKTEQDQTFHDANNGLHETYLDDTLICDKGANTDHDKVSGYHESETPSEASQESSTRVGYDQICQLSLKPWDHGSLSSNQCLDNCLLTDPVHSKNYEKNISVENSVGHLSPSSFEPLKMTSPESSVQLVVMPDIQYSDLDKELDDLTDAAPKIESSINIEQESVEYCGDPIWPTL